jgi:hypothetical protein
MTDIKAVITGDFIDSRAQTPEVVDKAMAIIARQADRLADQLHAATLFTRYRGDGWQIYLDLPGLCLSASFQITAALRAADLDLVTRQSIGLGAVAVLPAASLAAAQGAAFEASGLGLDRMEKSRRIGISGRGVVTPWHEAIVALADWSSRRWSREQAEAIELHLRDGTQNQAELAARLNITRQAFQARLAGAGLWAWSEALSAFEGAEWGDRA